MILTHLYSESGRRDVMTYSETERFGLSLPNHQTDNLMRKKINMVEGDGLCHIRGSIALC